MSAEEIIFRNKLESFEWNEKYFSSEAINILYHDVRRAYADCNNGAFAERGSEIDQQIYRAGHKVHTRSLYGSVAEFTKKYGLDEPFAELNSEGPKKQSGGGVMDAVPPEEIVADVKAFHVRIGNLTRTAKVESSEYLIPAFLTPQEAGFFKELVDILGYEALKANGVPDEQSAKLLETNLRRVQKPYRLPPEKPQIT